MKASGSNQRQEDSVSCKKFLPGKLATYIMIGVLPGQCQVPRYNTIKCQLQSMSGTGTIPLNASYNQCQVPRYNTIECQLQSISGT